MAWLEYLICKAVMALKTISSMWVTGMGNASRAAWMCCRLRMGNQDWVSLKYWSARLNKYSLGRLMRSATASFDSLCTCGRLQWEMSELVVAGVLARIDGGMDGLGVLCSIKGVGAIMGVEIPILDEVPIWGDRMTASFFRFRISCSSRSSWRLLASAVYGCFESTKRQHT